MKVYSIFSSGVFLVLLCLITVEGKKSPTERHTCRKGLLSQVTENLYIKAASLKSSIPKDLIKNTRLLKKTTKVLFMTNCKVRDELLSFYMKNVFSHLGAGSDKLYIISAFQVLQTNMNACGQLGSHPAVRLRKLNPDTPEVPAGSTGRTSTFPSALGAEGGAAPGEARAALGAGRALKSQQRPLPAAPPPPAPSGRDPALPCAPSTRLTSAVKKLKKTFLKLGEKGIYKAIHELDILLPWIQAYIRTIL